MISMCLIDLAAAASFLTARRYWNIEGGSGRGSTSSSNAIPDGRALVRTCTRDEGDRGRGRLIGEDLDASVDAM